MLAKYNSKTVTLHPYSSWDEMSREIPVIYNDTIFTEKRCMLSEHNNNYYLKAAYDLFEKIFNLPNVVFHPVAHDGHLPYYNLNYSDFEKYKSELTVRGICFISNVLIHGSRISGTFSYYITRPGVHNRNEETYSRIIQTIERLSFIDVVLKDLDNI